MVNLRVTRVHTMRNTDHHKLRQSHQNMRRMTENPKSLHMSCLNFEPSSFGWVCNVCESCWRLCHFWCDKHCKPQRTRCLRCTNWHGRRVFGSTRHSKSTLIILLWWSKTQMLGGPLDQTEHHNVDILVFIANAELLQGNESNISLMS